MTSLRSSVSRRLVLVALIAVALLAVPVSAEQAKESVLSAGAAYIAPAEGAPMWQRGGAPLYDNGPLTTCLGCGVGGADESVLQNLTLGMTLLGAGHQVLNDNRVADEFVVPEGHEWTCTQITGFAYQTGSDTNSTMTAMNYQVWDGIPAEAGSTVVQGDGVTDQLMTTGWTGTYRVAEDTSGIASDRPIMANTAGPLGNCGTFGTGEYWLDWQVDGSLGSGPWAPPITITGSATTGNGRQSVNGVAGPYDPVDDDGSLTFQGFPFIIDGSTTGPTLNVTGSCPGSITLTIDGGTPGGSVTLLSSLVRGPFNVPVGGCAGSLLGIQSPSIVTTLNLNGGGGLSLTVNAPASACGLNLEALDTTTCSATTVGMIPTT